MRQLRLAIALMLVILAAVPVFAQVPKTVFVEMGSATWCGYCPRARAGIEVMHANFTDFEFESAEILATSGGLGIAEGMPA